MKKSDKNADKELYQRLRTLSCDAFNGMVRRRFLIGRAGRAPGERGADSGRGRGCFRRSGSAGQKEEARILASPGFCAILVKRSGAMLPRAIPKAWAPVHGRKPRFFSSLRIAS